MLALVGVVDADLDLAVLSPAPPSSYQLLHKVNETAPRLPGGRAGSAIQTYMPSGQVMEESS